jgi:hypothetical protein
MDMAEEEWVERERMMLVKEKVVANSKSRSPMWESTEIKNSPAKIC